jgi:hypothetical protein
MRTDATTRFMAECPYCSIPLQGRGTWGNRRRSYYHHISVICPLARQAGVRERSLAADSLAIKEQPILELRTDSTVTETKHERNYGNLIEA